MYLVYILYSERLKKFYTGFTIDLKQRLEFHQNAASTKFTHNANDWTLYLTIECKSKEQGLAIEKHIKAMKSSIYIRNLKLYPEMFEKLRDRFSIG